MRTRLLDLVVCPRCGDRLEVGAISARDGEEIVEGSLRSPGCGAEYPVRGGIPRLLPDPEQVPEDAQTTVERFGEQWNRFDFLGDHYEDQFLGWIRPNQPEVFEGQVVLEGGCGKGRHSALVAGWGAKDVLAIDLGSSVEAAYRNTRDFPNVHVVQADLFHLPVAARSVDVAFSVGVLHHTPDPKACFRQLEGAVRSGGRVIAWVYGRENNGWIIHGVNPVRENLTSKLPFRVVYELAKLPAAALIAVGRGIYQPLSKGPLQPVGERLFYAPYIRQISSFPFAEVHSIVHDHLTPRIAHYIPGPEFRSWFEEAGLREVGVEWHNQNSWRGTGVVP
ncbi:MAG: methyltransferase domain-containing protein [Myxococcota bacterium]